MQRITRIHQIEITTRCNLRCVYCPSPNLPRAKADMDVATFERALEWVRHYLETPGGTQDSLSLTGIGEPTLHPMFLEFCQLARKALPQGFIHLATNGILLTEEVAATLALIGVKVDISLHVPEKARHAVDIAKRYGILHHVNPGAIVSGIDWAGQIKNWRVTAPVTVCQYLEQGWGCVLVDGRITTCCMDADGSGVVGHVMESIEPKYLKPYGLCKACHLKVPERMAR